MSKYRVFHGYILAYVQATGEQGEIKIGFASPWLEPAEIGLNVKQLSTIIPQGEL